MLRIVNILVLFFCFVVSVNLILAQDPPYGLNERIPNTSFLISSAGDTLADMKLNQIFSNLTFSRPVFLTHAHDGNDRIFVVEKQGIIKVFPNQHDVSSAKIFMDISDKVNAGPSEAGLLSMAFHPDYPDSAKFYVYYNHGDLLSRISEFKVSAIIDSADTSSERIILELEQPYSNHNGGQIAFGFDGLLYIGFGDGGSGGDPLNSGQDLGTLLGAILRIDVDNYSDTLQYSIPPDNPHVGNTEGWREEIWAWGLRNPWRFSFDRQTGDLWAGDVGQGQWEEVDLVRKGKNYGWRIMEGFHCYNPATNCDTTGLSMPVAEYNHDVGRSITGGYVYRGARLERLDAVYIYGDYVTRKIWGFKYQDGQVTENKIIAESPSSIAAFGEDETGEVYVVGYDGKIYIFDEKEGIPRPYAIPKTISESGLFSNMDSLTPAPGLIPYSINSPFWSDGADKTRIIALPDTSQIEFSKEQSWLFPSNTVIVKNFFVEMEEGLAHSRKIIETRFLVKQEEGEQWDGFSYAWNDSSTDASLLDSSMTKAFLITSGDSNYIQQYYYPSRSQCLVCHTPAAGYVLGLKTSQVNKQHLYINDTGSVWDNQLRSYNHIGLFNTDIGEDYSDFPKSPNPLDEEEDINDRARSYLDANCANCHLPGGSGRSAMDLRYKIPLEDAQLVNIPATFDAYTNDGIMRLRPGAPDSSALYLRMMDSGILRMPPLASLRVDQIGSEIIASWIDSLHVLLGLSEQISDVVPTQFKLHQAYPNPFNPVTTISYDLPWDTYVTISIFDIRGKIIQTLISRNHKAGKHSILWNAGNYASGLYFYRLEAGDFIRTKKVLLLK
jgi:uncharacterized repeat protein (TIGR03806 family)